jgi:hypothetical protein
LTAPGNGREPRKNGPAGKARRLRGGAAEQKRPPREERRLRPRGRSDEMDRRGQREEPLVRADVQVAFSPWMCRSRLRAAACGPRASSVSPESLASPEKGSAPEEVERGRRSSARARVCPSRPRCPPRLAEFEAREPPARRPEEEGAEGATFPIASALNPAEEVRVLHDHAGLGETVSQIGGSTAPSAAEPRRRSPRRRKAERGPVARVNRGDEDLPSPAQPGAIQPSRAVAPS